MSSHVWSRPSWQRAEWNRTGATRIFAACSRAWSARVTLRRVTKTISPRHITALCGQAPSAVLCEAVDGYDIPVAGGLYWTRDRLASALGWPVGELGSRFASAVGRPLSPILVNDAPCQEVVSTGDDVDLTTLPIPFMHEKDGALTSPAALPSPRIPSWEPMPAATG